MNLWRRTIVLMAVALFVLDIAASNAGAQQSSIAGKYFSQSHPEYYVELRSDKTFVIPGRGRVVTGTYEVEGNQVTLKTQGESPTQFKLAGKTLIDPEGERWTKKSSGSGTQSARPGNPSSVVSRYITALQKRDFKTVIDLSLSYQQEVAKIKAGNPQALWPKLVGEYYDGKIKIFSQQAGYWQNYGESLGAMMGDPARDIRSIAALLPATCKWNISETRHDVVTSMWDGRQHNQDTVYVTVGYPAWEDAPFVDGKLLKQTILQFTVDADVQLLQGAGRVSAADAFTDDPFRIANVTWGQPVDPNITFSAAGGTPPFSCTIQVGAFRMQKDCYRPQSADFYADINSNAIRSRAPWSAHIAVSDSKGRSDEVSFLVPGILPGLGGASLWKYCWIRDPWFKKGALRPEDPSVCKGGINRLGETAASAERPPVGSQPSRPAPGGPSVPSIGSDTATCGDYNLCMQNGAAALKSSHWDEALADFQSASSQRPDAGNTWVLIGLTYLAMGRNADLQAAWDKALSLGQVVGIRVCHERSLEACEQGLLLLSPNEISFVQPGGQKLFAAPPSDVIPRGVSNNSQAAHVSVGLRVSSKNYNFDVIPLGVDCSGQTFVQCPQQGVAQQLTVSDYITQAIPKLASGTLGKKP